MLSQFDIFSKVKFRLSVRNNLRGNKPLLLNVGAGGTSYPGWISAEKKQLDITKPNTFSGVFPLGSIKAILAEHVVEHITEEEFIGFMIGIREFLRNDACIRIAVPDALHPSIYVRDLTRPGGLEPGADDHKEFYSVYKMRNISEKTGYKLIPVEYFDHDGLFRYKEEDWSCGYIARSFRNYRGRFTSNEDEYKKMIESTPSELRYQFSELNMSYTSLIVDFKIER
ncbi:MAG: hypothetical protein KJ725_04920 [Gammaproteobacteria bacterium]|nr:hypothetical protein [Gammaproteobacteria bacterium]